MANDVLIIGAGVIGLSLARELAGRGKGVCLLERGVLDGDGPGGAATRASLGVLSVPDARSTPLARLHRLGYRGYPELARELLEETGIDAGYRVCGALHIDRAPSRPSKRESVQRGYRSAGSDAFWLLEEEVREAVPGLAESFRAALHLPGEAVVHPSSLVRALAASCRLRGVCIRDGVGNASLASSGATSGAARVTLESGEVLESAVCVLAAGAWLSGALGRFPDVDVPVRPVRGQAVELFSERPEGPTLHFHSKRFDRKYYLIARPDHRAWIGATVEEAGFDAAPSAAGVEELLAAVREVLPAAFRRDDLVRTWAGLRPQARRRGGPFLGLLPGERSLWIACGHYRTGILAGPASARLLASEILGDWQANEASERDLLRAFAPEAR